MRRHIPLLAKLHKKAIWMAPQKKKPSLLQKVAPLALGAGLAGAGGYLGYKALNQPHSPPKLWDPNNPFSPPKLWDPNNPFSKNIAQHFMNASNEVSKNMGQDVTPGAVNAASNATGLAQLGALPLDAAEGAAWGLSRLGAKNWAGTKALDNASSLYSKIPGVSRIPAGVASGGLKALGAAGAAMPEIQQLYRDNTVTDFYGLKDHPVGTQVAKGLASAGLIGGAMAVPPLGIAELGAAGLNGLANKSIDYNNYYTPTLGFLQHSIHDLHKGLLSQDPQQLAYARREAQAFLADPRMQGMVKQVLEPSWWDRAKASAFGLGPKFNYPGAGMGRELDTVRQLTGNQR